MKRVLLIGFSLVSFAILRAQTSNILPVNEKTGKVTFMEVVDVEGMSASESFKVLRDWAKEMKFEEVSSDGTEAEFKGSMDVSYRDYRKSGFDEGVVNFAVHLMSKDGRYRYIFTDFMHESKVCSGGDLAPVKPECPPSKMSLAGWTEIKKATRTKINRMIDELKEKVKEVKNDPTKNDDW